jgi:hypothetical protein
MCEDKNCDCGCQENEGCLDPTAPAPAFDMFAQAMAPETPEKNSSQSDNDDDILARAIMESIEKLANGILTLQQEIALITERVEAHEAHLAFLLTKDPTFCQFLKDKEAEMKQVAINAQDEQKTE